MRLHTIDFLINIFDSICYDCCFFFVEEEPGTITANGQSYSFSANTAIFLPAGTKYYLYLNKSSQLITYELPEAFSNVLVKQMPGLTELLHKCAQEFSTHNSFYRESASALLKLCLIEFQRNHNRDNEVQKTHSYAAFHHSHYHNVNLTNEMIATKFNYNPGYLSQMMKNYTSKSLHQYLISYRLKIAKENLINTDDSINIIAWKSGFQSTAYFIKTFKEQTGTSVAD